MAKKCTIFYVDNDLDDLGIFGDVCETLGYEVTLFNAPEQMIFALENTVPCVLFVDLSLPHSSGYEITAELKSHKKFKQIPIIAYSDTMSKGDIARIKGLGADFFIRKPMNPVKIREAIREAFAVLDIDGRCGLGKK